MDETSEIPPPDFEPLETLRGCRTPAMTLEDAVKGVSNDRHREFLKQLRQVLSDGDVDAAISMRDFLLSEIPAYRDHVRMACAVSGVPGEAAIVAAGYAAICQDLAHWLRNDAKKIPHDIPGETPEEVLRVEDRLRGAVAAVVGWAAVADGRTAEDCASDRPADSAYMIGAIVERTLWDAGEAAAVQNAFERGRNHERRLIKQAEKAKAEAEALTEPDWAVNSDDNGVVVIRSVGSPTTAGGAEAMKTVKSIFRKPLPLATADIAELAAARETLVCEFPHGTSVIDALLLDVQPGRPISLRSTVLLGEPGGGKSRLARRFLEVLKIPYGTADASTSSDHGITGTRRGWHGAHPSLPVTIIERTGTANPAIVVDELEKAGRSSAGSMHDALLSLVERSTAKAWRDQFLDADVDVSHLSWVFTANALEGIPMPLRNRLRILRLPRPGSEHIPALAALVLRDLLQERGVDPAWEPPLDGEEIAALVESCGENVSIRNLRRFVEGILDARRRMATRN
ncbi:AAA family ATPase [Microvirga makkahensis]|uniref:AAA family ATPase n=1 Tax=Microvirga makkahensis TaxID=1128670 RepID=A0A7X3MNR9_9HYPH|nr:AAA family ATPase [Microvirga makkahensis]MXQ10452.1 AAA family ATPase [Microvirga makkahensis]